MSKEPLKLSDKENLFKKMMDEDYKNIFQIIQIEMLQGLDFSNIYMII